MIYEKKTWPDMFEAVLSGKKRFDVRLSDASYKEGDTLVLREWDPHAKKYTGRTLHKRISFVLNTKTMPYWPGEDIKKFGLSVLSLEDLNP